MASDRATNHSRARATQLLIKVIETRWFDRDTLAAELVISPAMLDAYLAEQAPVPLDRQLLLARFVIERVPPFARLGHQLLGQVRATMLYESQATATHAESPPLRFR